MAAGTANVTSAKNVKAKLGTLATGATQTQVEKAIQDVFDSDGINTPAKVEEVRQGLLQVIQEAHNAAAGTTSGCCYWDDGTGLQCDGAHDKNWCDTTHPGGKFFPGEACMSDKFKDALRAKHLNIF